MAIFEGTAGNNTIWGTAGNDEFEGKGGNDRLYGRRGNDDIEGDGGDDWLFGGYGRDRLEGGPGNDRLTGGPGADIFEFEDENTGRDVITDFQDGLDRIEIDLVDDNGNFSDLRIRNDGNGNATVAWDDGFIRLLDVQASQLTRSDFLLD